MKNLLIMMGRATETMRLCKGEELWHKLNANLPKPVAVIMQDQPRVDEFAKMVKKLHPSYRRCLREYLQHEIDHVWDDEMVTALQEKAERKRWQIMKHHLEAIAEPKD